MRFAVIGAGANVFSMHATALQKTPALELVGISDVNLVAAEQRAEQLGCPYFADHAELIASTRPEAVAILAPHPFHARLAIDCLQQGLHVLVEKPIGVDVADADDMIAAAHAANRLLAVNLQHRTRGEIRTAAKLIAEGRLGELQRVQMSAIWTRTRRYYAMAGWRGTWRGEGGGVLMNQSPHTLDLVCHLAGQPSRVTAWNRTLYHTIETEDTSMSMLEWPNGALGTLFVSTAQAGEAERMEIAGTHGILTLSRGGLQLLESKTDLREFLAESPEPFAKPPFQPTSLEGEMVEGSGDHAAVYANFVDAVQHGTPLVADGQQARMSLELANALIYSSVRGQAVDLPLDRAAYRALLDELRTQSESSQLRSPASTLAEPRGQRKEPVH